MTNQDVQNALERTLKAERRRVITDDLASMVEQAWKMDMLERCIAALAITSDEDVEEVMEIFNKARREVYDGRQGDSETEEAPE